MNGVEAIIKTAIRISPYETFLFMFIISSSSSFPEEKFRLIGYS